MSESQELAQIGVTGLAVMGRNLARNLARHGYRVAVHNRTYERTRSLVAEHGDEGTFVPAESVADFVASLERPRAIIIMVKAGAAHRRGDRRAGAAARRRRHRHRLRQRPLRRHPPPGAGPARAGLHFVGTGVSGGEEGALNGPSIMPGGSAESYRTLGPIFESIAAQVDGRRAACTSGRTGPGTS